MVNKKGFQRRENKYYEAGIGKEKSSQSFLQGITYFKSIKRQIIGGKRKEEKEEGRGQGLMKFGSNRTLRISNKSELHEIQGTHLLESCVM